MADDEEADGTEEGEGGPRPRGGKGRGAAHQHAPEEAQPGKHIASIWLRTQTTTLNALLYPRYPFVVRALHHIKNHIKPLATSEGAVSLEVERLEELLTDNSETREAQPGNYEGCMRVTRITYARFRQSARRSQISCRSRN